MDDQLLREFLGEADERVEALFADIERLRRIHAATDGRARRAIVARIFRHVHTLKGTASTIPQLASFSRLAHEFENLLDAIRNGRATITDAVIDTCEDATNALSIALASVAEGDAAHDAPPAIFKQLRRHAGTPQTPVEDASNKSARAASALPEEIAGALSAVEQRQLGESMKEGARAVLLDASFDLATLDEHFTRFTGALAACGEVVSTFPGEPANTPDEISFRILYTTTCAREELESHLAPFGAKIAWTGDETMGDDDNDETRAANAYAIGDGEQFFGGEASGAESPAGAEREESNVARASQAQTFVRVPLKELDELVEATHELFTDTLAVLETSSSHAPDAMPHAEGETHAERTRRLREDFGALEDRVMSLRMQPLKPVLERAARSARIAARAAGKEIELEVAGGEVRVDRALAEQIGEPLVHLLRNAIDHGIETAEERRAAGKHERGRVRVEVAAEGSRVCVRVADDGRGIDTERVARVAVAQGLLEAGARISDEHALRLIFRPGFSTAGRVSTVSGRGVGLDVVEHALERAGGDVRVRATRGAGTTFELRVPLTLALVRVVCVRANGHAYAFDANHVVTHAYLEPEDIAFGDAESATARWHGQQLPLISLRSLLEGERALSKRTGQPLPVVVMRRGRDDARGGRDAGVPEQFVIAVDEIEGEREALVRSLGRHATRWRGISGAFARRDGTVTLLLDLPRLLERFEIVAGGV
ncbi:MAG TPA: ATP-binding protein [Pyrinomonadaceae bacterium]|nr:ATP-binding protein [Pyrinomonadaceae bacterium]